MTAVVAAAMAAAGVAAFAVFVVVMVTVYIGVIAQIPGQQGDHSSICFAGNAAVQANACLCQSHLRTAVKMLKELPRDEAENFLTQTLLYLKKLLPKEEKEEFKMDFIKTSEAYGYETIADAEEKALAKRYEEGDLNARREMAKALKNNGASLDLIANVSCLSEEEIRNL